MELALSWLDRVLRHQERCLLLPRVAYEWRTELNDRPRELGGNVEFRPHQPKLGFVESVLPLVSSGHYAFGTVGLVASTQIAQKLPHDRT